MKLPWTLRSPEPLTPLEGYERWSSTYNVESNPIKNLSNELVRKFLPDLAGKRMFDAGCGTGLFCTLAESFGAAGILGLDLSPAMINEARKNCQRTEFVVGDLENTQLTAEAFDVVVCALVLGHIKNLRAAIQILASATKAGGTLIITDFHPFLSLRNNKRTFTDASSSKTYEIIHHTHLLSEYFEALTGSGMRLVSIEEPMWENIPVVFGMCCVKN